MPKIPGRKKPPTEHLRKAIEEGVAAADACRTRQYGSGSRAGARRGRSPGHGRVDAENSAAADLGDIRPAMIDYRP
jgi:hypothetical protein